ncbi:MAG: HEAT repeat domain-containing protein [Candidatus Thorarchaeota archaeon]
MKIPLRYMEQNNDFDGLARALNDDSYNRENVIKALGRLSEEATEYYIKRVTIIKNTIDTTRAAVALGYMKVINAVEPLIECLAWVNQQVVENKSVDYINTVITILHGLGNIGDKRAIEPISDYLYHSIDKIRLIAVLALKRITGQQSTDHLIQFLKSPEFQKGASNIKTLTKLALIEEGSDVAMKAIFQTFDIFDLFDNEFHEALGKKVDRKMLTKILELASNGVDNDAKSLNINSTLRNLKEEVIEKNIDLLITSLRIMEKNVIVGEALMDLLGKHGDSEAFGVLLEKLPHEIWQYRRGACINLGKIGDTSVLDALEKTTKDKKLLVRWAAKGAIKSIRKRK